MSCDQRLPHLLGNTTTQVGYVGVVVTFAFTAAQEASEKTSAVMELSPFKGSPLTYTRSQRRGGAGIPSTNETLALLAETRRSCSANKAVLTLQ